jgi:predicted nuclease with TOPRIM domain
MITLISSSKSALDIDSIKKAFSQIQEEFEEHLAAINENTDEIQANCTSLYELDNKIAKLNDKIDEIYNVLNNLTGKNLRKKPSFEDIDPLTTKEKTVFLNLYTELEPMTYADLAKKMNMPIELTRQYVINLMEKGIPIQRTYKNTRPYITLDPKFRNLQAKKNILKIEQRILV